MNYEAELINLITNIKNVRFLAFLYGLIDELMKHPDRLEEILNT